MSGTSALPYANSKLGVDVTIVNAGTYYDGPSISLTAGTWFITAYATLKHTNNQEVTFVVRISTGTTHYASAQEIIHNKNPNFTSLSMTTVVILTTTTTIKLQATADHSNDAFIIAATGSYGSGNNATQISAIRIG